MNASSTGGLDCSLPLYYAFGCDGRQLLATACVVFRTLLCVPILYPLTSALAGDPYSLQNAVNTFVATVKNYDRPHYMVWLYASAIMIQKAHKVDEAVMALEPLLLSSDEKLRESTIQGLGQLPSGNSNVINLIVAATNDKSERIRSRAIGALLLKSTVRTAKVKKAVIDCLNDRSLLVQRATIQSLNVDAMADNDVIKTLEAIVLNRSAIGPAAIGALLGEVSHNEEIASFLIDHIELLNDAEALMLLSYVHNHNALKRDIEVAMLSFLADTADYKALNHLVIALSLHREYKPLIPLMLPHIDDAIGRLDQPFQGDLD